MSTLVDSVATSANVDVLVICHALNHKGRARCRRTLTFRGNDTLAPLKPRGLQLHDGHAVGDGIDGRAQGGMALANEQTLWVWPLLPNRSHRLRSTGPLLCECGKFRILSCITEAVTYCL